MDRAVFRQMELIDGDHWWFVARRDIVEEVLERHLPSDRPLKVLEIGCGTGSNLPMLSKFGSVDAIEPDDQARGVASKRFGVDVGAGHLPNDVQLEDGKYGLIVMMDVLEHVGPDIEALAALKPKLAPGGRLVITVPAMPWLWSAHDVAHHHHRRYTQQQLRSALQAGGYSILHQSHFNTLLFPLVVAARTLSRLLGRERADDRVPSAFLNRLLKRIFGFERRWVPSVSVPVGVSIIAVSEAR